MRKRELESFKQLLMARRAVLAGNLTALEGEALGRSAHESAGNLSTVPSHMADIASDAYEQSFNLQMLMSEEQELNLIDDALRRIEAGTYGVCESCANPIPKLRMKVQPQSRMCVPCQEVEDQMGAA